MSTRKEIIQAWKENERVWLFMTKDMQVWAAANRESFYEIGKNSRQVVLYFEDACCYRLHADYTEKEEEIIELKLEENHDVLSFPTDYKYSYTTAPSIIKINGNKVSFAGYKYADGLVSPRDVRVVKHDGECEPIIFEFPVSVLFRKVGK